MMEALKWLEAWYLVQCDGDWEHLCGITIETLDNPGWHVRIDLQETTYENMQMKRISCDNGPLDWIVCSIENSVFEGSGDSGKLSQILEIFQRCVKNYCPL